VFVRYPNFAPVLIHKHGKLHVIRKLGFSIGTSFSLLSALDSMYTHWPGIASFFLFKLADFVADTTGGH